MSSLIRFDGFEVDLPAGQIRKRGIRLGLRDQAFQVLASLLEHPGQVVTREDLRRRLWPGDVFVDFDNSLNIAIARLRTVLGDSAEHPRFIETLPKRGYRFIGHVSSLPSAAGAGAPRKPRLLVLPFVNLSGDAGQEYVSDAATDEVITELAALAPESLGVIARTTAMRYKGARKDVARIGRELNVDYVVEGGVRREGDRITITVQFVRAGDETHLFARRYECGLHEAFDLRTRIAEEIAAHIEAPGVAHEVRGRLALARGKRKPTANLAAYNEYIQGRYLAERMTPEATAGARQHFEEAIHRDPEFALAYVALADLYSQVGYLGYVRPRDAYAMGFPCALRAVELDDALAEAHAVLAEYHKQLDYNWPAAEREMARALELNPTSPLVRLRHALAILMPHDRMDEALAELQCALELDPLAGLTRAWFGIMWALARDYDRAIEAARVLLELEPASCWPPFIRGITYRQKYFEASLRGEVRPDFAEQAIAGHRKAAQLGSGAEVFLGWLGLALGVCGCQDEARAILEKLQQSPHYVLPSCIAHVYYGLGELDAAFQWFDRAVEERDQNMMMVLSFGHLDPVRNDPRLWALLHKMKLQPQPEHPAPSPG
ncbi:MAG: winged helix-turn-helix domain-containing protein [Terriglobia bacterium]